MKGDLFAFLKELPRSYGQIGAMLPSSPMLGKLMVEPVRSISGPRKILEVGPGTGPFTRQILRCMDEKDSFVICEINARFLSRLKDKLANDPFYLKHKGRVHFFEGSVQDFAASHEGKGFDLIVSSLPFSNFNGELVEELLSLFRSLLTEHGTISFCEYWGLRKLSCVFSNPERRQRLEGVERVVTRWTKSGQTTWEVSKKLSMLNVPPALAIQLHF